MAAKPDQRFVLANERTYLAYIRTAIALVVGGAATLHLEDLLGSVAVTRAVGAVILLTGIATVVVGYRRWRDNDRAIAADEPLRPTVTPFALAAEIIVIAFVVAVLSLI
ncbi:putative membrane protein [Mumia flava]|uniref:Putative membrane protein n=1 Tax=Mumia flava TaxID=1348852 RepID=A0A0B2BUJ2_9ACTN|nr:DUF202 domain-containing protein [Mumia flava]PJJ57030.1 putative membrane protein [Mumia flava]